MENVARIIITIFFIGLIALAIVFFGVFGLIPLDKVGKLGKTTNGTEVVYVNNGNSTSSEQGGDTNPNENTGGGTGTNTPSGPIPGGTIVSPNGNTTTTPWKQEGDESVVPYVPPTKKEIKLDVPPGSPNAPQQSPPLSPEQIPASAVKIVIKNGTFTPPAFVIKKGKEVILAITSEEARTHIFTFDDPSLSAIAIGVSPFETRAIAFTPPATGEFWFKCTVPGHRSLGEEGKMVIIE